MCLLKMKRAKAKKTVSLLVFWLCAVPGARCSTNPLLCHLDDALYIGDCEEPRSDDINLPLVYALLGTIASSSGPSGTPASAVRSYKYIFVTATTYTGSLYGGGPGVSQIDAKCNSDSNRPDTNVTYKALIGVGSRREACTTANCSTGAGEHTDWVLAANQEYRRADGTTVIGTATNVGIFDLIPGLSNSWSGSASEYWSGLADDWTLAPNRCVNGADWNTTATNGSSGALDQTDTRALQQTAANSCSIQLSLLCVEQ